MSEIPIRLAISVLGTLALGISVYHRLQAASSGDRFGRPYVEYAAATRRFFPRLCGAKR